MTADILGAIDELQLRYAAALDEKDMAAWLATFSQTPTASYICTSLEAETSGQLLAMMLDDCHARLEDRVTFVTKVWAGTFQDYQTRHIVQRVKAMAEGSLISVRSNFIASYTPEETGQSGILASGYYDDLVEVTGNTARFLSKKAVMDASVLPHYLVYPL
ncbi:Salicylate 5-hydroxylase, small oxygenase component [Pigmentiphaga humi]|uniref:Salicylate 5-hydroxylase, small oxygenase component n=1 Tax=Pigmentiphaga humi TaxID=2478468 RepID=A0A3P4AXY6_9BURK|nr:aromatic-ring-hydroxylating dioxygenase subunit beta [Pigmentiphaga humi]VCU68897.1 Salicylate 5-hydroxylase, small oxygenase component [Pigmentiphaga humi]